MHLLAEFDMFGYGFIFGCLFTVVLFMIMCLVLPTGTRKREGVDNIPECFGTLNETSFQDQAERDCIHCDYVDKCSTPSKRDPSVCFGTINNKSYPEMVQWGCTPCEFRDKCTRPDLHKVLPVKEG